jgi:hypothetical protein
LPPPPLQREIRDPGKGFSSKKVPYYHVCIG